MIFIDEIKNLKIYKTPVFLPTLEHDKKKGSAILLLSPNYESSKKILNYPLFINRGRFVSYYMERNVAYYINDKNIKNVDESSVEFTKEFQSYDQLLEMTAAERNKLPDSAFGIPSKRKYPLDTPARVKSAIRFFNYCDKEDEEELARNIIKAIKKFKMEDQIHVGPKNRFSKYYHPENKPVQEAVILNDKGEEVPKICPKCGAEVKIFIKGEPVYLCSNKDCNKFFGVVPFREAEELDYSSELFLKSLRESDDYLLMEDKVIFLGEASANDTKLREILYSSQIKQRKELILLYDQLKLDVPYIQYTFTETSRYQGKNLFVDLYYYNKIFFENNTWFANKGMRLYLDLLTRLINHQNINPSIYKKKTIIIPIADWSNDTNIWNYRYSLNPISIIYQLMINGMKSSLDKIFESNDILFLAKDKYFKINFSELDFGNIKKLANSFKLFLIKIVKNEEFDASDIDTSSDQTQSKKAIKANIIDKIEQAKGVDLTSKVALVQKMKQDASKTKKGYIPAPANKIATIQDKDSKENIKKEIEVQKKENSEKTISKASVNKSSTEKENKRNANLMKLAKMVDDAGDNSYSEDDAWDDLDNDEAKEIIMDLDNDGEDKPNISEGRAARISELDKELMEKEIKGKTIKELLDEKPKEEKVTSLPVSSPNTEWESMKFMNFDKDYPIDKYIVSIFRFFSTVSHPISILDIDVQDNSTSEDRLELYTVNMEDYRGKRFTIKLDIPIMVDNRFLLRGNYKSIQNQFFNMPIIKTDIDTCQIISNYMKIFVRRFGTAKGKSLPLVSKFIRAVNKYEGRKIKFTVGDNKKICVKYHLPIDYIDLSGVYTRIETEDFIIYFNQDEIRSKYTIEEGYGIPYLYEKKENRIVYYKDNDPNNFITVLMQEFTKYGDKYSEFAESVYHSTPPTICTYSRCSIMNSQIPMIVICAYHVGLRKTMDLAKIKYDIRSTLTKEDRYYSNKDWIKFKDGYIIFESTYESSLLMNGLKDCPTDTIEIAGIDNRNTYFGFLDNFGGRVKADGLDNFYDLIVDPITKESLEHYKMPTDYISILLYANALLADNKYVKHTDTSSRKIRRYELIPVYTYKVLAEAYGAYVNYVKKNPRIAEFSVKQSAVIDRFLTDSISSDDSCINALRDIETTNSVTTKGPSGLNSDRAYSLDKRTYDDSMLNVLAMSTGFAANSGITRQTTINANITQDGGYVKSIDGDTSKMNTANTLSMTEALTPFGSTHDDPMRTAMTFIQTAKHEVRTEDSDPLLVTNGADEAMVYLSTDRFAYKAKKKGKVEEITDEYIMLLYEDGTKEFINLTETIEKNSDGGYFVPLKLDAVKGLKVGSRVKEGQVVAYDKYSFSNSVGETDNLAYNVGKLAKVAVINSDEGFEDSGVITEKLASKLATRIDLKFDVTLDKQTQIISMKKIGDPVEAGESLMVWLSPFEDEEANSLMKSLTDEEVSELGKKRLNSEVTGVVKGIKIYRTVELEDMSDSLRRVVNNYEKPLRALYDKLKEANLDVSQIPAHYILPATGKLKKARNSVLIEYFVEYKDTVGVGDKVVYFSANKAVEKNIIPLGKEPYTEFRPNESIDAFVSEVSIDKRMVTSTIIYGALQKLMIELDRSVKDIMNIPYDDSTV